MNTAEQIFERAHIALARAFHPKTHCIIEGVATTARRTSHGFTRNPMGASYRLPIPLFADHNFDYPIGWVQRVTVGPTIQFSARVANWLPTWGGEIWYQLKSGGISDVSIGADTGREEYDSAPGRRFDIVRWSWVELSIVTAGANEDAKIHVVREIDNPDVVRLDGTRGTVFRDVRHLYRDTLPVRAPVRLLTS